MAFLSQQQQQQQLANTDVVDVTIVAASAAAAATTARVGRRSFRRRRDAKGYYVTQYIVVANFWKRERGARYNSVSVAELLSTRNEHFGRW